MSRSAKDKNPISLLVREHSLKNKAKKKIKSTDIIRRPTNGVSIVIKYLSIETYEHIIANNVETPPRTKASVTLSSLLIVS